VCRPWLSKGDFASRNCCAKVDGREMSSNEENMTWHCILAFGSQKEQQTTQVKDHLAIPKIANNHGFFKAMRGHKLPYSRALI